MSQEEEVVSQNEEEINFMVVSEGLLNDLERIITVKKMLNFFVKIPRINNLNIQIILVYQKKEMILNG